jgi:hypothetical protein
MEDLRDQAIAETARLNAVIEAHRAELHATEVDLQEQRLQRERAEETSSYYLRESQRAMALASERGKVISVLVEKIRQLEDQQ